MVVTQPGKKYWIQFTGVDMPDECSHLTLAINTAMRMAWERLREYTFTGESDILTIYATDEMKCETNAVVILIPENGIGQHGLTAKRWDVPSGRVCRMAWEPHPNYVNGNSWKWE